MKGLDKSCSMVMFSEKLVVTNTIKNLKLISNMSVSPALCYANIRFGF